MDALQKRDAPYGNYWTAPQKHRPMGTRLTRNGLGAPRSETIVGARRQGKPTRARSCRATLAEAPLEFL